MDFLDRISRDEWRWHQQQQTALSAFSGKQKRKTASRRSF
jgi:hypothetical protein